MLSSLRDADDAVYGRNGYGYGDSKLRVEYPRSSGAKFGGPMEGGRGGGGGGGPGGPRGRFGPPTRRSEFRVIVTGRWTLWVVVRFSFSFLSLSHGGLDVKGTKWMMTNQLLKS